MIYFVRHGATDWNDNLDENGKKAPRCQGRVDIPLNQNGIKQAEETARQLADKKFARVICSPLIRARQTCDIVYRGETPVEIDERVIERDFGEFEGLTRAQFDFAGFWNKNNFDKKYERAESIKDVQDRLFPLFDELKDEAGDVLIVAHGGLGCVFMSYFKEVPDGNYLAFEIPHGKPLVVEYQEKSK